MGKKDGTLMTLATISVLVVGGYLAYTKIIAPSMAKGQLTASDYARMRGYYAARRRYY